MNGKVAIEGLAVVQQSFLRRQARSSGEALLQGTALGTLRLLSNPLALIGIVIIVLLVLCAVFAPLLATYDPVIQNLPNALKAPSAEHWLGTDEYGRDVYSRLIWGSRTTLYIVSLVTVTVGPIGLAVGTIAGYFGGLVEVVLMRITDLFLSFPSLVLTLAFVAALGPSLENAVIAISLTSWPMIARLARAETLSVRSSDYIAAARLIGVPPLQIIIRHVVPMCLPSTIIRLTLNMASVILTAAGLGFLGLGAQPPTPEWGVMMASGRQYMLDSWWLVTFPGLAILLVSLAFNLFGDGLRDVLDSRLS
ncbi:MAG TPA: ABC transporter permease [Devosiaceae bacterium]|jgi:peptide/nickel transport system permease protein